MSRRSIALAFALAALLAALPASGHRLPAPGGEVRLALPDDLRAATIAAHTGLPVVEPVPESAPAADRLAHPALPGLPWRSRVLSALRAEQDSARWRLVPRGPASPVADAVAACLSPESSAWPGRALAAAGVTASVEVLEADVVIDFSDRFGPTPGLLAGCSLADADGAPFRLDGQRLVPAPEAIGGAPLPAGLELRGPLATADLAAGSPDVAGGGALVTEAPDVVLLVQSQPARRADPLGLDDGLERLRALLDPELLLAVFWEGRGGPVQGLLPPGIAPSRPLPPGGPGAADLSLRLDTLPDDAPRLDVSFEPTDPLVAGVVERLAVILRSRGWALGGAAEHAEVVRWRPPTLDPALALLALAGTRPSLAEGGLLEGPGLRSADPDLRLSAALAVERAWIEERRVVPLMTADRWVIVDPDLRGVVLRPDGVPLLLDAWWAVPR